jgi:hypothetical protein
MRVSFSRRFESVPVLDFSLSTRIVVVKSFSPSISMMSAAGNGGTRTIVSVVEINLAIPDSMVI